MAAATITGTIKGILSTSQTVTGLVVHSVDFNYQVDKIPFEDKDGNVTSVAYHNPTIQVDLKGEMLAGGTFTATLASTLSLSAIPAHLPTGTSTSGGSTIIESIKIGEAIKQYKSVDIGAMYYPSVS